MTLTAEDVINIKPGSVLIRTCESSRYILGKEYIVDDRLQITPDHGDAEDAKGLYFPAWDLKKDNNISISSKNNDLQKRYEKILNDIKDLNRDVYTFVWPAKKAAAFSGIEFSLHIEGSTQDGQGFTMRADSSFKLISKQDQARVEYEKTKQSIAQLQSKLLELEKQLDIDTTKP